MLDGATTPALPAPTFPGGSSTSLPPRPRTAAAVPPPPRNATETAQKILKALRELDHAGPATATPARLDLATPGERPAALSRPRPMAPPVESLDDDEGGAAPARPGLLAGSRVGASTRPPGHPSPLELAAERATAGRAGAGAAAAPTAAATTKAAATAGAPAPAAASREVPGDGPVAREFQFDVQQEGFTRAASPRLWPGAGARGAEKGGRDGGAKTWQDAGRGTKSGVVFSIDSDDEEPVRKTGTAPAVSGKAGADVAPQGRGSQGPLSRALAPETEVKRSWVETWARMDGVAAVCGVVGRMGRC